MDSSDIVNNINNNNYEDDVDMSDGSSNSGLNLHGGLDFNLEGNKNVNNEQDPQDDDYYESLDSYEIGQDNADSQEEDLEETTVNKRKATQSFESGANEKKIRSNSPTGVDSEDVSVVLHQQPVSGSENSKKKRNPRARRSKPNSKRKEKKNNREVVSMNTSSDNSFTKLSDFDDEELLSITVFHDMITRYPGQGDLIERLMDLIAGSQRKTQIANQLIRQINAKGSGQLFLKNGYSAQARDYATNKKFDYTLIADTRLTRNIEAISHFLLYTIFQQPKFRDEAYFLASESKMDFYNLMTKKKLFDAGQILENYAASKRIWTEVYPVNDYDLIEVGSHAVLTGVTVLMKMGIHMNSLMVRTVTKEGKGRSISYRPKLEQTGRDLDNHNPFRASHKVSRYGNIYPKNVFSGTSVEDFFKIMFAFMSSEVELISKYPPHVVDVQPDLIMLDWAEELDRTRKDEPVIQYVYRKFKDIGRAVVTLPQFSLYQQVFRNNCKQNSNFAKTLELYKTLPIFSQRKDLLSEANSCLNGIVSMYLAWGIEYKSLVGSSCQTKNILNGKEHEVSLKMTKDNLGSLMRLDDKSFEDGIRPAEHYRVLVDNLIRQVNDGKSQTIVHGDLTVPRTDMALKTVNRIRGLYEQQSTALIMGDKTFRYIKTNQDYKVFQMDSKDRVITTTNNDAISISPDSINLEDFPSDILILTDDLENLDGTHSSNFVLQKFFKDQINIFETISREFDFAQRKIRGHENYAIDRSNLHKNKMNILKERLKTYKKNKAYLVVRNDNDSHGFRRTIVQNLTCHFDSKLSNGFHTVFRFEFDPSSLIARTNVRKNTLAYQAAIYHFSKVRALRIVQNLELINGNGYVDYSYLGDLDLVFGANYLIQNLSSKEKPVEVPSDYGDDFDLYDGDADDFDLF